MSDPVLLRMRAAGVPPYAFRHTLAKLAKERFLGLAPVASAVTSKAYQKGVSGLVSYAFTGKHGILAAATMAKELVLVGEQVHCTTALALAVEFPKQDWMPYSPETLGYWVVPDFAGGLSTLSEYQARSVVDFVLSFAAKGGGLVLGLGDSEPSSPELPEEFVLALQVFELYQAN
jgi:hypothetical protein